MKKIKFSSYKIFYLKAIFACSLASIFLWGFYVIQSYNSFILTLIETDKKNEITLLLKTLQKEINESQNQERGYVISGSLTDLKRFDDVSKNYKEILNKFEELTSENKSLETDRIDLRISVMEAFSRMREIIELKQTGRSDKATQLVMKLEQL